MRVSGDDPRARRGIRRDAFPKRNEARGIKLRRGRKLTRARPQRRADAGQRSPTRKPRFAKSLRCLKPVVADDKIKLRRASAVFIATDVSRVRHWF